MCVCWIAITTINLRNNQHILKTSSKMVFLKICIKSTNTKVSKRQKENSKVLVVYIPCSQRLTLETLLDFGDNGRMARLQRSCDNPCGLRLKNILLGNTTMCSDNIFLAHIRWAWEVSQWLNEFSNGDASFIPSNWVTTYPRHPFSDPVYLRHDMSNIKEGSSDSGESLVIWILGL